MRQKRKPKYDVILLTELLIILMLLVMAWAVWWLA